MTDKYTAETSFNPEINSTAITLTYHNSEHPSRNLTVSIAPELGSNLYRLRAGDHDLIHCELDLLKQRSFTGIFVLWPFPNRVRNRRYTYQGKQYSLEEVPRPMAPLVHGLVFDQSWQHEQPEATPSSASVTTFIDIMPDFPYYSSYPFPSRLSLTYTLTEKELSITYHVQNKGTQTLPYGFGLHPYFALHSGPEETVVSTPAEAVMEAKNELPTGRVFDLNELMYAMYDLRSPIPVKYLKLDHVYTNLPKNAPAIIDHKKQHIQISITTSDDFTHTVLYTPAGEPYCCVEQQTCSTDAINFHNLGPEMQQLAHLLEVAPGETATGTVHYAIHF